MTDKVTKFLKGLNDKDRHDEIFKAMMFFDTTKEQPNALISCEYDCEDGKCDFLKCLLFSVENNEHLVKWKIKDVCEEIVQDIAKHQNDYLPCEVDGFYINKMGHKLIYLKRKKCNGNTVTGIIEYNTLLKNSMEK